MAVGEEQHYGRAARRLRVAQPALSRQVQDLEEEIGFELFERLPRGVKLSAAGKLFLEDVRRLLQEVNEAVVRAGRVASGRSGTLRVGFTENASWRGVVPDSFRRFRELQPDAELELQPAGSLEQLEAVRSGRLDAGFVFNMPKTDPELELLPVAVQHIELAALKGFRKDVFRPGVTMPDNGLRQWPGLSRKRRKYKAGARCLEWPDYDNCTRPSRDALSVTGLGKRSSAG